MTEVEDQILENVYESSAQGDSFIERLAAGFSRSASAATIYGHPVEQNGVMIIPVARAQYGFGGGGGPEGQGGGGGVKIQPVGYIELRSGSSAFHAIHDPAANHRLMLAGLLVAPLILHGLARLMRC